jgi:hypothetical protein
MEDTGRVAVWAAVVVGSIALVVFYLLRTSDDSLGIRATASMAERYGLFIIIVLGEVVVGVVDGLGGVEDLDFGIAATGRSRAQHRLRLLVDLLRLRWATTARGRTVARSCCGSTAKSRSRSRWRQRAPAC